MHLVDGGFTVRYIIYNGDPLCVTDETHNIWVIRNLCHLLHMTPVGDMVIRHIPPGISIGTVIAESHIFLHTWPETSAVRLIIDSCVDFDMTSARTFLSDSYDTDNVDMSLI